MSIVCNGLGAGGTIVTGGYGGRIKAFIRYAKGGMMELKTQITKNANPVIDFLKQSPLEAFNAGQTTVSDFLKRSGRIP